VAEKRVIAVRGNHEQLLLVDHHDPEGHAHIYHTARRQMSGRVPLQRALKMGYWRAVEPTPLREHLANLPKPDLPRPSGQTGRYERWRPYPRWGGREGIDPVAGHDRGMHPGALADKEGLVKALRPLPMTQQAAPPPAPHQPLQAPPPSPAPQRPATGAIPGATFHYDPSWGRTHYGTAPPNVNALPARIGDHVAIRPKGADESEPQVHARVIGHLQPGGIRIRHTESGHEENLLGPQTHRAIQMAPGTTYGHGLPNDIARAHRRDMSGDEAALPAHESMANYALEVSGLRREGPQVGARFRELLPHDPGPGQHPFGPQHEVVHVYPSGHALLLNRESGEVGELHPQDFHAALNNHALRVEPGNYSDEHGDHDQYRKMGGLLRPEEYGENGDDDDAVADKLQDKAGARLAGPIVRGLTDGDHGLQKLIDAYTVQHGNLRSELTHIQKDGDNSVTMLGRVHHDDGYGTEKQVGDFRRTLHLDDRNNLVAHHDYLELPEEHQGGGFAQAFNDNAEQHYRDMGVHRIELHADITVGKYAWAQQGFDFADKKHRQATFQAFKDWADHHGLVYPKRDFDKHMKSGTAWDLANYDPAGERVHTVAYNPNGAKEKHVDGHYHIGKSFLLGDASQGGWHGQKYLDPNSAHQRQAEAYRSKNKGKGGKVRKGLFFGRRDAITLVKAARKEANRPYPPAKRKLLPRRRFGGKAMEGRGPASVGDTWYHGDWVLANDPQVARGLWPNGRRLGAVAKSAVAPAPGEPRRIEHPGARGGHFWYDDHGTVRYGERPGLGYRQPSAGDHVLYGGAHGRVTDVAPSGHLGVRLSGQANPLAIEPGDQNVRAMAPASRYGNELPPALEEAHGHASASGLDRFDALAQHRNPRRQRERMATDPRAGDRWSELEGGKWGPDQEVLDADGGRDVVFHAPGEGEQIMSWSDWRRLMASDRVRISPRNRNLPDDRYNRDDDDSPAGSGAAQPMHLEEEEEDPRDDDLQMQGASQPQVRAWNPLRAEMADRALTGDCFAVVAPITMHGVNWTPQRYDVTHVDANGDAEVWDEDGNAIADLSPSEWEELINHMAVSPQMRGEDMPEEEEEFTDYDDYQDEDYTVHQVPPPGLHGDDLVRYVLPAQDEAAIREAWTNEDEGNLPGGYYTQTLALRAFTQADDSEARDGFYVEGEILDGNGSFAGHFKRSVYKNDRGEIELHHDLMMFGDYSSADDGAPSQTGFAAAFNAKAEEHYLKWGIDCVTTFADISIGKYVWARQGFDFERESQRHSATLKLLSYAAEKGIAIPEEDAERLGRGVPAWEIAAYHPAGQPRIPVQAYKFTPKDPAEARYHSDYEDYSFLVDGEFTLGRAYLLDEHHKYDNSWDGIKYLKPGHPTYEQGRQYLAGKKK
jgi:hypothetical protein